MKKIKSWLKSKKARMGMALCAAAVSLMSFASAAEEAGGATVDTTAIKTSFTTGVNNRATTTIDILGAILPFALSIVSVYFVVKKGISWIKKI